MHGSSCNDATPLLLLLKYSIVLIINQLLRHIDIKGEHVCDEGRQLAWPPG